MNLDTIITRNRRWVYKEALEAREDGHDATTDSLWRRIILANEDLFPAAASMIRTEILG